MTFTAATSGNYTLELGAVGSVIGTYSLRAATIAGTANATSNTYSVSSASTVVIEGAGGIGRDVVSTSVSYALSPGSEIEVLQVNRTSAKTAINLTGNEFAQTLIGDTGANVIKGKGGATSLRRQRRRPVRPQQHGGDLSGRCQSRRDHGLCRRRFRRRHAILAVSRGRTS